jgi:hypothetical protein
VAIPKVIEEPEEEEEELLEGEEVEGEEVEGEVAEDGAPAAEGADESGDSKGGEG